MGFFSLVGKIRIDGAEDSAKKLDSVSSSAKSVQAALVAAAGAGVAYFARTAVDAAANYDSLVRSLETVSANAGDLRSQLVRLQDIAKLPGIGFEEAVRGSLRLQSVGLSAKLAERTLVGFANAVAKGGGGKADFAEAIHQLSQIASVGKLAGDELRVIAERVPGFSNVIKAAFGTLDTKEINKMGLSTNDMIEKITAALEKMPKATGGIRNAMDNMADVLNQKLYVPIGRIGAALMGAFGPALERLLTAAAPGMERMARAAESLSKSRLSSFFNNTVGSLQAFNRVVAITAGVMVAMAGPRVVGQVVNGVTAMIKAIQALRAAIQTTGLVAIIMEGIATKGKSLAVAAGALAAGLATAAGVNYALNNLFSEAGASKGPFIPEGLFSEKKDTKGLIAEIATKGIEAAQQAQAQRTEMMSRYLLAIERNTAKSADALEMRRQTLGAGELGRLGVSAAELNGSSGLYSPPEVFARPAAAELERVMNKMINSRLSRMGAAGRPRTA